ncbi:sporulation protein YunB [Abyssisolibacter fermentans]|uniref:sporulation protein YunB n=1 Tax=Abyssisolibacter fermentans TaxID=1766203 RepID=UPI001FA80B8D|nr:sporulation protein YunB [Abyssisolibacter fermentans]
MGLNNGFKKRKINYNKNKTFFIIVGILVVIIYGFYLVDRSIKPIVLAMSEVRARMIATQAINDAVKNKIKGDIKYKDLIYISYDKNGKVATMQANTILMNSIASEVALEVQKKMKDVSASSIKIPIGNALKSQILSQYGPKINVDIMPLGSVKVDFATKFEESGINQTIHRVYLTIQAQVRIVIPLGADTAKITSTVPIAETIIIGDVPQSFISVPKDDFLNVIPGP